MKGSEAGLKAAANAKPFINDVQKVRVALLGTKYD